MTLAKTVTTTTEHGIVRARNIAPDLRRSRRVLGFIINWRHLASRKEGVLRDPVTQQPRIWRGLECAEELEARRAKNADTHIFWVTAAGDAAPGRRT